MNHVLDAGEVIYKTRHNAHKSFIHEPPNVHRTKNSVYHTWHVQNKQLANPLVVSASDYSCVFDCGGLTRQSGKAPRKQLAAKSQARKTAVRHLLNVKECPLTEINYRLQLVV